MKYQTINEERGARRAAELRRRFREVSGTYPDRSRLGFARMQQPRSGAHGNTRQNRLRGIPTWCVLAAIVIFFGFIAF